MDKRDLINGLEVRFLKAAEIRMEQDDKTVKITGYAAVFNSLSEDLGFREIILPSAFTNTLAANPDVRLLINHNDLPLARTTSKTLRLFQDDKGLGFEAICDRSDPDVQRVAPKIARGDLSQCSFAFRTVTHAWRFENEQDVRELHEVDINDGDVSLVTYPAYKDTSIALRSRDAWKKSQQDQKQLTESSAIHGSVLRAKLALASK